MFRVITDRFHSILTATSRKGSPRRSRVVLILLSISLVLGGRTFGASIVPQTLEFDGKEYSLSSADQTTDWQWSTSASSVDANFDVITRGIFNQEEGQAVRGVNRLSFSDGQADQTDHLISFRSDRFSIDKPFTREATSIWSFTSIDDWFLPMLLFPLMMVGIGIGLPRLFPKAKREESAHRRKHRVPKRRLSIASEMARIRAGKLKNS